MESILKVFKKMRLGGQRGEYVHARVFIYLCISQGALLLIDSVVSW